MGPKPIKQTIEVDILGKVDQFEQAITRARSGLSTLSMSKEAKSALADLQIDMLKNLDKIRTLAANNQLQIIDVGSVEKAFHSVEIEYKNFIEKLNNTKVDGLSGDLEVIKKMTEAQATYNKNLEKTLQTQKALEKERDKTKIKLQGRVRPTPGMSDADYTELDNQLDIAKKTKGKAQQKLVAEEAKIQEWFKTSEIKSKDDSRFASSEYGSQYLAAAEAARKAAEEVSNLQEKWDKETAIRQQIQDFDALTQKLNEQEKGLKSYNQTTVGPQKAKELKALKATLLALPDVDWSRYNIDINSIHSMDDFKKILQELSIITLPDLGAQAIKEIAAEAQDAKEPLGELGVQVDGAAEAANRLTEAAKNADKIAKFAKQFIGWAGAARLARKAVNQAYETIKELDAQMTDMAVVTDYTTSDYWAQLPDYTARANQLGVAIKDVYSAATLYYQQGLKTDQVTAVTTNTLKMARIAGLDAAEATNRMTSALRGFNMEINEASAERVSDVYSQLAAITAANTEEISRAMGKTASLASSAGMEFETTAAFLAQIIETTRESAETAGTALTEKFSA